MNGYLIGIFHDTKKYLGEPLANEFEDEWKKNIVDIVTQNQEELRNDALKPVMIDVVNDMFENLEEGDGAQRFLTAVQIIADMEEEKKKKEEEAKLAAQDNNGSGSDTFDENYQPDPVHAQLSQENKKLTEDMKIEPLSPVSDIDEPRQIDYQLAKSGVSRIVSKDGDEDLKDEQDVPLDSVKDKRTEMIMNESLEMKGVNKRRDRKSTDLSTNGTGILRSPSDVMSESGNEAGMIYLKDSLMNESVELTSGMDQDQMIESYVDDKIDTAQADQKEAIEIFSQPVTGPNKFNPDPEDDDNDVMRGIVTRHSMKGNNENESQVLYPFYSNKDPNAFQRDNALEIDKKDVLIMSQIMETTDSLDSINDDGIDIKSDPEDLNDNEMDENILNDLDDDDAESPIPTEIKPDMTNMIRSNLDLDNTNSNRSNDSKSTNSNSNSNNLGYVYHKAQVSAEENSIEIEHDNWEDDGDDAIGDSDPYEKESDNNDDEQDIHDVDNDNNEESEVSTTTDTANTEILHPSPPVPIGGYRITITAPPNENNHTFPYGADSHTSTNSNDNSTNSGHTVQHSDSMVLAD